MTEKKIPAKEARIRLKEILNRAKWENKRTIICRHGEPVAAVVPMEDLEKIRKEEQPF